MTGRPAKSLAEHVRDGTFRARRLSHRELLAGALVPWPGFAILQQRFQTATSEPERRAIALEFEHGVTTVRAQLPGHGGASGAETLQAALAELGKPGSSRQLLAFFPHFLRHPKGPLRGQPFQLEPWQRRFLREFYRRDTNGRRVYRNGVLSVARGCGKTPLAAAVSLYELVSRTDAPEIYCAAGSKEQALIALGFARSFVEDGPLNEWVRLRSGLTCPATAGTMKVVSSDGRLQHGRMPAVAVIDELWALETEREEQTYMAFASALHKRDDAFLLAITTAGYNRRSLLGRIYEQALEWPQVEQHENGYLTIARDPDNGQLLWWHAAPADAAIDDPAVWRAANPASWISVDALRRQLADPGLDELEFRRLNLNQWTATRNSWLPAGLWPRLQSDEKIPDRAPIYVGVDVGIYHDTTAISWAHVVEDGRILLRCRVWAADENAVAHRYVPGGRVQLEEIEHFILNDLATKFRIVELAYDPYFFQRSAELLEHHRITVVEFMQGSAAMPDAYQAFYQYACEGKLCHNGDPVLAAHIEATAATKTERGWKIHKLRNTSRIDATVAAVLAVTRARHHKHRKPDIHWVEF